MCSLLRAVSGYLRSRRFKDNRQFIGTTSRSITTLWLTWDWLTILYLCYYSSQFMHSFMGLYAQPNGRARGSKACYVAKASSLGRASAESRRRELVRVALKRESDLLTPPACQLLASMWQAKQCMAVRLWICTSSLIYTTLHSIFARFLFTTTATMYPFLGGACDEKGFSLQFRHFAPRKVVLCAGGRRKRLTDNSCARITRLNCWSPRIWSFIIWINRWWEGKICTHD